MITWKILDIQADAELITYAKYHVAIVENGNIIETEGNWKFQGDVASIPFKDITEEIVINWIKNESFIDGKCIIESRLIEQLQNIQKQNTVVAPWLPQVFTPTI